MGFNDDSMVFQGDSMVFQGEIVELPLDLP